MRALSAIPARFVLIVAAALIILAAAPENSRAAACTVPIANPVACENTKPGTPASDWQIDGAGDPSIQGFGTSMSVNKGTTVHFKIKTPSSRYHLDILRLGYYGGAGARKVAADVKPTASLPQSQPACLTKPTTGLIDCGNWGESASWAVPSDAVSGVYIAHLVREDVTGADSQIPFVVRDDAEPLRHGGADLRRHLAGLQHLRRQQPLHVHGRLPPGTRSVTRGPSRSPTTGRSTPPRTT